MKMSKILALCASRHEMPPEVQGSIFANAVNPTDIKGLRLKANKAVSECSDLTLYVTGLSVALAEVIKSCYAQNCPLKLMHWDSERGIYYEQIIIDKLGSACGTCGGQCINCNYADQCPNWLDMGTEYAQIPIQW